MFNKKLQLVLIFGVIISLSLSIFSLNKGSQVNEGMFGGLNHNVQEDFSEGISVDGTTVIDGDGNWEGAITSSSVQIGDTTDGIGEGCIVLGDSGGATSTPVYVTASGETLTATTTQPSICDN